MGNYYEGMTPLLISVDCIVFGFEEGKLKLLIGKRKMNPGKGEWSLYGGFVQANESLEQAATRTLCSLTGLDNIYMTQVGAYGAVDRDPGERVISIAYCSLINVSDYNEVQQKEYGVEWVSVDELPDLYSDHKIMVTEAIEKLRSRSISRSLSCRRFMRQYSERRLTSVTSVSASRQWSAYRRQSTLTSCQAREAQPSTALVSHVSKKK